MSTATNIPVCHQCPRLGKPDEGGMGGCPCTVDGRDIIDHAASGDCPEGRFAAPAGGPPPAVDGAATPSWDRPIEELGPELWAWLHCWAGNVDLGTPAAVAAARAELDAFALRLPCGDCRLHWLDLLAVLPPDFSSNEALYAWTVETHNRVNDHLGKPRWSPPTDQNTSLQFDGTPGKPAPDGEIKGRSKAL